MIQTKPLWLKQQQIEGKICETTGNSPPEISKNVDIQVQLAMKMPISSRKQMSMFLTSRGSVRCILIPVIQVAKQNMEMLSAWSSDHQAGIKRRKCDASGSNPVQLTIYRDSRAITLQRYTPYFL